MMPAPSAAGGAALFSAPASAVRDGPPTLRLPLDLRWTPDQFALGFHANPQAVLERSADGRLIPMPPIGGDSGRRNSRHLARLQIWAEARGGFAVFDSSTGFRLANGSVLSPDEAVVRLERWQALTPEERHGFPPLCPDLVVEPASPGDGGPRGAADLREKMAAIHANGAWLGWMLLPEERAAGIWRAKAGHTGGEPHEKAALAVEAERVEAAWLEGEETLPGFRLALAEIWEV